MKNVRVCLISMFSSSDSTTGKTYIMMEARLVALFKTESEYTVLDKWVCGTCGIMKWLEEQSIVTVLALWSGDKCQKPLWFFLLFTLSGIRCAEIHFQEAEMFFSLKETAAEYSLRPLRHPLFDPLVCSVSHFSAGGDKKWFATWKRWSSLTESRKEAVLKPNGSPFPVGFLPTHLIY